MPDNQNNGNFAYEIVEHLAVLRSYGNGWRREINMVSWNGGVPRLDIRDWSPDHTMMSKGFTMDEEEGRILLDSLMSKYGIKEGEKSRRDDDGCKYGRYGDFLRDLPDRGYIF